jgi:hypothetical protein
LAPDEENGQGRKLVADEWKDVLDQPVSRIAIGQMREAANE